LLCATGSTTTGLCGVQHPQRASSNAGIIVGAVIGAVAGISVAAVALWYFVFRKRDRQTYRTRAILGAHGGETEHHDLDLGLVPDTQEPSLSAHVKVDVAPVGTHVPTLETLLPGATVAHDEADLIEFSGEAVNVAVKSSFKPVEPAFIAPVAALAGSVPRPSTPQFPATVVDNFLDAEQKRGSISRNSTSSRGFAAVRLSGGSDLLQVPADGRPPSVPTRERASSVASSRLSVHRGSPESIPDVTAGSLSVGGDASWAGVDDLSLVLASRPASRNSNGSAPERSRPPSRNSVSSSRVSPVDHLP
jgi:hypothetical protein